MCDRAERKEPGLSRWTLQSRPSWRTELLFSIVRFMYVLRCPVVALALFSLFFLSFFFFGTGSHWPFPTVPYRALICQRWYNAPLLPAIQTARCLCHCS